LACASSARSESRFLISSSCSVRSENGTAVSRWQVAHTSALSSFSEVQNGQRISSDLRRDLEHEARSSGPSVRILDVDAQNVIAGRQDCSWYVDPRGLYERLHALGQIDLR